MMRCRRPRNRWYGPASFVVCGLVVAGVQIAGSDSVGRIVATCVLFGVIAVGLALGGRSETVRAMRGDLSDERLRGIELRAEAFAGRLVILATVIGFLVELARGHSAAPFYWLAAIGGFGYLAAYLYGARR